MESLLSTEEVGAILKISKAMVQRWCHKGKIPAAKIGKAYRINIERWYEEKFLERTVFR
jgi:excisionase family DNA binding protein